MESIKKSLKHKKGANDIMDQMHENFSFYNIKPSNYLEWREYYIVYMLDPMTCVYSIYKQANIIYTHRPFSLGIYVRIKVFIHCNLSSQLYKCSFFIHQCNSHMRDEPKYKTRDAESTP